MYLFVLVFDLVGKVVGKEKWGGEIGLLFFIGGLV